MVGPAGPALDDEVIAVRLARASDTALVIQFR